METYQIIAEKLTTGEGEFILLGEAISTSPQVAYQQLTKWLDTQNKKIYGEKFPKIKDLVGDNKLFYMVVDDSESDKEKMPEDWEERIIEFDPKAKPIEPIVEIENTGNKLYPDIEAELQRNDKLAKQ